jgi:2-phosphoglycerate kinase
MIYLIGGAPRLGKSIIAALLAKSINAQLVSTDNLEMIEPGETFSGDPKKNILTPEQRLESIKNEARQVIANIHDIIEKAGQDTVIEGVHLFPNYIDAMIKTFGDIKAVLIGSSKELILDGMKRNTSENNWTKDADPEVLNQIAEFAKAFSDYVKEESKKYNLPYVERSNDFQKDIDEVKQLLS